MEVQDDYVSIEQAARELGLSAGQLRRVLRQYGLGELLRATMRRPVLIRRADLQKLRGAGLGGQGRGAA